MIGPFTDFQRYLTAKVTVDDRALNKDVWAALAQAVRPWRQRPLRVLEVGAGVATMAQRLWRWRLHPHVLYTGVDVSAGNIAHARKQIRVWAQAQGASMLSTRNGFVLHTSERQMTISLVQADALDYVRQPQQAESWDLLIAHAFLDLVDVSAALPDLLAALQSDGLCYFTLNFDGETIFEPVADETYEARLMALYHRSMDERLIDGRPAGHSRTGRRLFGQLRAAGADVLAAGASDWVVMPAANGYPADEAWFLHFIIATVHRQLRGHPQVGGAKLEAWASERHRQIDAGELLYIAHQLDYLARKSRPANNAPASPTSTSRDRM